MKVAYDLDGTLISAWWEERHRQTYSKIYRDPNSLGHIRELLEGCLPIMIPAQRCTIITSRPRILAETTMQYIKLYNLPVEACVFASRIMKSDLERGLWKARAIKEAGSSIYVEDEPALAAIIKGCGITVLSPQEAVKRGYCLPVSSGGAYTYAVQSVRTQNADQTEAPRSLRD